MDAALIQLLREQPDDDDRPDGARLQPGISWVFDAEQRIQQRKPDEPLGERDSVQLDGIHQLEPDGDVSWELQGPGEKGGQFQRRQLKAEQAEYDAAKGGGE